MKILPEYLLIVFSYSMITWSITQMFSKFSDFVKNPDFSIFLFLLLLLALVTYNQVQSLRINYQATEFLPKLELYG